MDFEVIFTKRAQYRLNGSITYISDVLCQPGAARRLYEMVTDYVQTLRSAPRFLIVDHEVSALVGERVYRKKFGRYRLLFLKDGEKMRIEIFSLLHDLQDEQAVVSDDYSDMF